MAKVMADDLVVRVRAALTDTNTPPWFPDLTSDLAESGWHELSRTLNLTPASYGTARVMLQNPEGIRRVVVPLNTPLSDEGRRDAIPVELLPADLARRCAGPDVRFFEAEEILNAGVFGRVEEALAVLGSVPTILPTVSALVRALHLIDTADDEIDVSFSEPTLPFSAFVSVPGPEAVAGPLRIAEALLHEAMHLQLTLMEAVVPLVTSSDRTYFSPWRNEYRTAQGVLHALYVFRVIDAFFGKLPFEDPALARYQIEASERRATIAEQVREISDFRQCADLTSDGAAFVGRLID
jgi:HEXXH motif-containing protein